MRKMGQLTIFGTHDENTITQMKEVMINAKKGALLSDGHLGYHMPIGGVAGYDNKASVQGVGYDIACGNCAILTDLTLNDITRASGKDIHMLETNPHSVQQDKRLNILADRITRHISFGIGRTNDEDDAPVDHPLFMDEAWYIIPNTGGYRDTLREKAKEQLGTVGSGNHYVDVMVDKKNRIWVGVHFGSRRFGHTIATNFMAIANGGTWGDKVKEIPALLDLNNTSGQDYWSLMNLAGRYAYAGREWVARKVVELLGGTEVDMVHNHHNFAWKENHRVDIDGQSKEMELIVVRKGATPAFPGQRGFIGGSMGDDAVIVYGSDADKITKRNGLSAGCEVDNLQHDSLFSTVHGAGRVMSRRAAAGKRKRNGTQISRGLVTDKMLQEWVNNRGVILKGAGLDESPHAYRRLPDVLREQGDTITIEETLRPVIVCMAGDDVRDPYKNG